MSNIIFRSIFSDKNIKRAEDVSLELLRHITLNQVLYYIRQVKRRFGSPPDVVLAFDQGSWREKVFPFYKWSRRQTDPNATETETAFRNRVFECFKQLRDEAHAHFPYVTIRVHGAEADDICSFFSTYCGSRHVILVSGDKDIAQLAIGKVWIFNPNDNKFHQFANEIQQSEYVNGMILSGDGGDGIPNILSDDDCFAVKKRQTPLTKKQIGILLNGCKLAELDSNKIVSTSINRYLRNQQLIDLRNCQWMPETVLNGIQKANDESSLTKDKRVSMFYRYLGENGLLKHLSQINELICEV